MNMKKVFKKILNWKIITAIITFLTGLFVGMKTFLRRDSFDDRIKHIEENNKRIIDESVNYADKRVHYFKKLKKRTLKKL